MLREIADSYLNFAVVATRQRELRNVLGHHAEVVVSLPYLADDIVDLDGLARLATTMRRAVADCVDGHRCPSSAPISPAITNDI